jgi:uncharacterized membrane protein
MPFCASCGSAVEGRFCAKCGAAVDAGSAAPGGYVPPVGAAGMPDNVASGLCYVPIVAIVFLLIAPFNQNKAVRFHAFQSIFLCVAWIAAQIVVSVMTSVMRIFAILYPLVGLGFLVLWVWAIVTAFQGKTTSLPVIGDLARQQA